MIVFNCASSGGNPALITVDEPMDAIVQQLQETGWAEITDDKGRRVVNATNVLYVDERPSPKERNMPRAPMR